MNYSKQELSTIAIAVTDASAYVNSAYEILNTLLTVYFEDPNSTQWMIYILQNYPDRFSSELFGVLQLLRCAKRDLDIYTAAETATVKSYFEDAKEKATILDIIKYNAG